jgi:hypothetical protein
VVSFAIPFTKVLIMRRAVAALENLTAGFVDATALLLLLYWNPVIECSPAKPKKYWLIAMIGASIVVCLGLLWTLTVNAPALRVVPQVIEFGSLLQGERRDLQFVLQNPRRQAVVVSRIEVSCHCLTAPAQTLVILPEQGEELNLVLDLKQTDDFVGQLFVHVKGLDPTGETAFVSWVRANVIPR